MLHLRRRQLAALLTGCITLLSSVSTAAIGPVAPAQQTKNRTTPGNFTGYGFDQCLAPAQWKMDRWLNSSPFLAIGIYVSGDSRGCRNQPNLTPTWVSTQLRKGWRLLPITLGPQASCSTHFPRYGSDETIDPTPGKRGTYAAAKRQARSQAEESVADASELGISRGSALWYDLESFDTSQRSCRESALRFLSAWSAKIHALGYLSGVYSSAGSGITILDQARAADRPFTYPDYIWIARWDGAANTHTTYVSDDGWVPHRRVKQYQGGHDETWGGVRINIDRNYLDLGKGSVPPPTGTNCARLGFWDYHQLAPGVERPLKVSALQCFLSVKGSYTGPINGTYTAATIRAAQAWQKAVGAKPTTTWTVDNWVTLLTAGPTPVVKIGSANVAVRRLQRALNAVSDTRIKATGLFDAATEQALRSWQKKSRLPITGVAAPNTWAALQR
jgi:hypothetical protein